MSSDQMKSAVQGANPYDLGIIGAGVIAFIFSLFSYYTYSIFGGVSVSVSAWHGFFGWFAALLALAASAALAAALFGKISMPFPLRLAALAAYAVAALCVILALFVGPGDGHGVGYWVSLLAILAGLALSFMRKDATESA